MGTLLAALRRRARSQGSAGHHDSSAGESMSMGAAVEKEKPKGAGAGAGTGTGTGSSVQDDEAWRGSRSRLASERHGVYSRSNSRRHVAA